MKRVQKMRAAFVVTVAVGGVFAAGCGAEPLIIVNPPPQTDGGDASMVDATSSACPMGPPMVGTPCSRADTTPCSYSFPCAGNFPGSALFACVSGRWEAQGGAACNPPVDGGASGDVPGGG